MESCQKLLTYGMYKQDRYDLTIRC